MEDRKLTEHFSFYELTKTSYEDLQKRNREMTDEQIVKLQKVAELLEEVRTVLGYPLVVTSGYRCPELNIKIGSSIRSQHLLCEAADFIPHGIAIDEAFRRLRHEGKDSVIHFGQLIWEKADREGKKEWIHISIGIPYREIARSGQILTMVDGHYNLIETV